MKNQKGFAVVEGLLILVIVAILGFTGWYVYNAHNKATDTLTDADSANSSVTAAPNPLKSKIPKYSYTAPKGWKIAEQYHGNFAFISVSSPDFKQNPGVGADCATHTGTGIGIFITNTVDPGIVAKMLAPGYDNQLQKDIKPSTLGGQAAVQYLNTNGECGWSLSTTTVYKNYGYTVDTGVSGDNDSLSPAVQAEYDNFVSSFKFL